ncbi:MAG: radical SAM protein [Muribaculaceae bacterium]|nr:radical SAM protein [Muribaculaceae bacterium]
MSSTVAKVAAVSRHRLMMDGDGVTTLVVFHACPLRCRYCLNPYTLGDGDNFIEHTPESLYEVVKLDELYFLATGGGVTFGGGEPCLRPEFISEFREVCGSEWKLNLETSLNVPTANVERLLPVADTFIIDIKDMNPAVYQDYTGRDNSLVMENLRQIADTGRQGDCVIRMPLIPGYNSEASRQAGRVQLESLGFSRFDMFTYLVR